MGSTTLWIDIGSCAALGVLVMTGLLIASGLRASLLAAGLPLLGTLDGDAELARRGDHS
ncbi:MAG: hypothetical protein ACKVUT_03630 [Gaiella sp.]